MTITKEQLQKRVHYIGASDCAAVLGLSRYKTSLSVWAEKTGTVPIEDTKENLPAEIGNALEELVSAKFARMTGKAVELAQETIFHARYPFMACNLDRRVVGEDADVEIKTTSERNAYQWTDDEIPPEYLCQVQYQMACTGRAKTYVVVLIGNKNIIIKEVARDEKFIAAMEFKVVTFWTEFVQKRVMPEAKGLDASLLTALYPNAKPKSVVVLGDEASKYAESIQSLKQDAANIEKIIKDEEAKLKVLIKDNEVGEAGNYVIKWINGERKTVDSEIVEKEFPEVYAKALKVSPFRRFSVTERRD